MPSSFFALLDDIATLLDDIAVLSKVAAQKTAGVLGDDLALNANQLTGLHASRELPVVWAVAKGSLVNKVVLVPAALVVSAFAPWLVTPLLMVGGAFLCYEGIEKIAHRFLHSREEDAAHAKELLDAAADGTVDLVALEKDKIKGAIRTDFILSAEIVVIALGTVLEASLSTRIATLSIVAAGLTLAVYGFVGLIVKLDDMGLWLHGGGSAARRRLGSFLIAGAPLLLKTLSVLGTIAMFLVGGGIVLHGLHAVGEAIHHAIEGPMAIPVLGTILKTAIDGLFGVIVGALALVLVSVAGRIRKSFAKG